MNGRPTRVSFAFGLRVNRQAIPLCRRPSGPSREKRPGDGQLKLPALTVGWRLWLFHLISEEWASARNPSLNVPVESVSPPRCLTAG